MQAANISVEPIGKNRKRISLGIFGIKDSSELHRREGLYLSLESKLAKFIANPPQYIFLDPARNKIGDRGCQNIRRGNWPELKIPWLGIYLKIFFRRLQHQVVRIQIND